MDANIRGSTSTNSAKSADAVQAYIAQWSAEFFEPRGLQVTLRRSKGEGLRSTNDVDKEPGQCRIPALASDAPTPSLSLSQSSSLWHTNSSPFDDPPDAWVSPKAAAANASARKVEAKLERQRHIHELKVQASQRKAQKAAEKLEKSQSKATQHGAKKARAGGDGGNNIGGRSPSIHESDEGVWELVVDRS